jgi:hypothetical protein
MLGANCVETSNQFSGGMRRTVMKALPKRVKAEAQMQIVLNRLIATAPTIGIACLIEIAHRTEIVPMTRNRIGIGIGFRILPVSRVRTSTVTN